jgi:hypothetical protein
VIQQPDGSGPDLIGEFQRWLIRSSARGVGRQVTGQIRSAFGRNQPTGDVWENATADPTPDEAPECAWCPLCRAARVLRESKPGRDTRVTAVSDALGMVVQDAFNVLDAALATTGRPPPAQDGQRPGTETAGQGGTAKSGTAKSGTAKSGTAKSGTAKSATTGRGPAEEAAKSKTGQPAARRRPTVAGKPGQGPGEEPAPGSPVGSPDEPDDRG